MSKPLATLLPCPFCGGVAEIENQEHGARELAYFAVCHSCACEGPWTKGPTSAAALWNRRDTAAYDALRAAVATYFAASDNYDCITGSYEAGEEDITTDMYEAAVELWEAAEARLRALVGLEG